MAWICAICESGGETLLPHRVSFMIASLAQEPILTADTDLTPSLAEQTAVRLRDSIVSGEIVPGQRLSETRLATTLNVSRNTLREVFRLLTREGLLRHEPNRGVFVATPSMASILDIYRVRRMIEVPAVAQAWPRHEAVGRMRLAVERAEALAQQADWRGVGSENIVFHSAIVALTDSPRLMAFYSQISIELRLTFGLLDNPEMLHAPYIALNRDIVDNVISGDTKTAAGLLDTYLGQSERTIMAAFARLE